MMTSELDGLHLKAKDTALRYRSSETELLQVLGEIESLRGYLPLGFNSLFSYCVRYLGLSEAQSYSFMAVAKKGREIPEFKKAVLKDYRMRHDPIEKAKRATRIVKNETTAVRFGARLNASRNIPRRVLHDVQLRDNGRCQFKGSSGQACGASFGVEVHHLEPWAYGGKHEAANLLTLCQRHHHYWHHRDQTPRTVTHPLVTTSHQALALK